MPTASDLSQARHLPRPSQRVRPHRQGTEDAVILPVEQALTGNIPAYEPYPGGQVVATGPTSKLRMPLLGE